MVGGGQSGAGGGSDRGDGGGGGGGGGANINGGDGGGRGISWDDPPLSDSMIFVFIEKVFPMDGWTNPLREMRGRI